MPWESGKVCRNLNGKVWRLTFKINIVQTLSGSIAVIEFTAIWRWGRALLCSRSPCICPLSVALLKELSLLFVLIWPHIRPQDKWWHPITMVILFSDLSVYRAIFGLRSWIPSDVWLSNGCNSPMVLSFPSEWRPLVDTHTKKQQARGSFLVSSRTCCLFDREWKYCSNSEKRPVLIVS